MPLLSPPHLLDGTRWKNRRIGLLGGSFNPPHEGHVHISLAALHGLHLDAIWWLVTPQNPLKALKPLPLEQRIALSEEITRQHPAIIITALERDMRTTTTYDSIKQLNKYFPQTDFIWITGMDNAHTLHTWNNWQALLGEIAMVHITRPPAPGLVQTSPLRLYAGQTHRYLRSAYKAPLTPGTTYWMMQKKMVDISSTVLRTKNGRSPKSAV